MNDLRDRPFAHTSSESSTGRGAPGRSTMTARLARRPAAPARDERGVADTAEDAVARAATEPGTPLPTPVQHQFEGSLGADLSAVRVHTGPSSQAAAHAVGAQAYATGDDIHFADGKYAPDDPFGLHLLAHEVAHTVQQRGGPPQRRHRLEVSTSGDAAEHEADGAADAMVRGEPATVGGAAGSLARKDEKPTPYVGPTPDTPFDLEGLAPATRAQIDALTTAALRPLVNQHILGSYTAFTQACNEVMAALKISQDKEEARQAKIVEVTLTAIGMILGPEVGAFAAGAAPTLQGALTRQVSQGLSKVLAAGQLSGGGAVAVTAINEAVCNKIGNEQVTKALAGVTAEKASGWVSGAASKLGPVLGKVVCGNTKEEVAGSYVKALLTAADKSRLVLLDAVAVSDDQAGLVAAYQRFSSSDLVVHRAQVEAKADHFLTQIAPTLRTMPDGNPHQHVRIDAYGRLRLAMVRHEPGTGIVSGPGYTFLSWVTPDMEAMALSVTPEPKTIDARAVFGHLPDPVREGAKYGSEQVVEMDAWGKKRLAIVKADGSFMEGPTYDLVFLRWVPEHADEQQTARIRGATQIGGIPTIAPGSVKGLVAPVEPPAAPH